MSVRVRVAGDGALLVETGSTRAALALHRSLTARPVDGVEETVPGARTVLVHHAPWLIDAATLSRVLRARAAQPEPDTDQGTGRELTIPVVYDGADLHDVATLLGCSVEEVVRRHTAAAWTVSFMGFAPGFGYLTSDDGGLDVPRRSSPRTRVPAGAVALAGEFGGVYPRESPGGWQLLGRTDAMVWDDTRETPALWAPGDRVRFEPVQARTDVRPVERPAPPAAAPRATGPERGTPGAPGLPGLEVVAPGLLTLVEDLGRPGAAAWGVSRSGAADPRSLRAANRAVGNPAGTAALESLGGLRLRAHGTVVVATAGAPAERTIHRQDRERTTRGTGPLRLDDGDELSLGVPSRGLRTYLAVRGGVAAPVTLGSRSRDVLAGLGPAPLAPGDLLARGDAPVVAVSTADVGAPEPAELPAPGDVVTLPLVLGPRDDWFTPASLHLLTTQEWEVTTRSNRVGLRLAGPRPLVRTTAADGVELASEGCVSGAVQVPPDGRPVVFLVDHPVTGGYPVVGAVRTSSLWLAGQVPPGSRLRFSVV